MGRTRRAAVAVVAHRGASGAYPENTLASIEGAVALGADAVEVDVRLTADRQVVVLHDASLARTTDVAIVFPDRAPWNVASFTLAEVRTLSAGSWHSPAHSGARLPTLREVLKLLAPTDVGIMVEVKAPQVHIGIERAVAAELRRARGFSVTRRDGSRLVVQSFDAVAVRRLRMILPSVTLGLLGHPPVERLAWVSRFADEVNPPAETLDAAYVEAVHAAGMTSRTFTVNRRKDIRRLAKMGVDAVITDVPDVAANTLVATRKPKHRKADA